MRSGSKALGPTGTRVCSRSPRRRWPEAASAAFRRITNVIELAYSWWECDSREDRKEFLPQPPPSATVSAPRMATVMVVFLGCVIYLAPVLYVKRRAGDSFPALQWLDCLTARWLTSYLRILRTTSILAPVLLLPNGRTLIVYRSPAAALSGT